MRICRGVRWSRDQPSAGRSDTYIYVCFLALCCVLFEPRLVYRASHRVVLLDIRYTISSLSDPSKLRHLNVRLSPYPRLRLRSCCEDVK